LSSPQYLRVGLRRACQIDCCLASIIEMGQDSTPGDGIDPANVLTLVSAIDSVFAYSLEEQILEKASHEEGGADLIRPAAYCIMNEYFVPHPFADEIASPSIVSEGSSTVGDIECSTYLVTYPSGQQARWSFGTQDNLPRRVERMMTDREGNELSIVLEVFDLDVSPDISETTFTFNPPDGTTIENYCAFLKVGSIAPLWTLTDRVGNTVSLEELRGSVVVLDFWATWCGPCVTVMPEIQSLFDSYSDEQVYFYGVNIWETADPAAFMDENSFTYGLLLEGDDVAVDYLVSGIPTLYIIDQNGMIAFVEVGANPEIGEMLTSSINRLLETD